MKRIISSLLIVALLAISLVGCGAKEVDRKNSAIYTDNFEITTSVLTYYFNAQYLTFLNTYGNNLESLGLDTTKPLAEQDCTIAGGTNWYDYFMDIAKERLTQCLVVSEQAKLDGVKLNKESKKEVENVKKTILADAKDKGFSTEDYITKNFGKGVTLDDIIKCTEMERLTSQYYDTFVKKLDISEDAMNKYYEGHKKSYCTVDYMAFSFPIETSDQLEINDIHARAISLSESPSPEKFKEGVRKYLSEYYQENYVSLKSEEIESKVDTAIENITINDATYSGASAASRWAFADERKAGDGHVIKNEEQNSFDVYYLVSAPTREDTHITTIRQILIDPDNYKNAKAAKKQAEEILETLKANDFSKKEFIKLASEYSDDTETATTGGLYENITKGMLKDAKALEEWVFSFERFSGDSAVIKTGTYGYHIVYIEEKGEPVWLEQVRNGFKNARFEDYISDLCDEYMVYENNNIIYKITEVDQSAFEI